MKFREIYVFRAAPIFSRILKMCPATPAAVFDSVSETVYGLFFLGDLAHSGFLTSFRVFYLTAAECCADSS